MRGTRGDRCLLFRVILHFAGGFQIHYTFPMWFYQIDFCKISANVHSQFSDLNLPVPRLLVWWSLMRFGVEWHTIEPDIKNVWKILFRQKSSMWNISSETCLVHRRTQFHCAEYINHISTSTCNRIFLCYIFYMECYSLKTLSCVVFILRSGFFETPKKYLYCRKWVRFQGLPRKNHTGNLVH